MENSQIGKILQELRIAQGLSIRDVSEKSGIDPHRVFRIMTGRLRNSSENDLIAIGGVLGISNDEVMHLARYDDGFPLLHKDFPELQYEQESLFVTSNPYINEMLRDTDPEEFKIMLKMLRDFAEKKKDSNKMDI